MNISKAIIHAEQRLSEAGMETPRLDAEVLLAHALSCRRTGLVSCRSASVDTEAMARFNSFIDKRSKGCPVAYITGRKEFWTLDIEVNRSVLIPRPETETVVEEALKIAAGLKKQAAILDICTGSGCIAAALASELPEARIAVSDISEEALAVASRNLAFAGNSVIAYAGDLFEPIEEAGAGPFDIITANPPYIADSEMGSLQREIALFEPRSALAAGPGGLDFIVSILEDAWRHLAAAGWLVMEVGDGQAETVSLMATELGQYDTARTAKDLAGIDRVILIRRALY